MSYSSNMYTHTYSTQSMFGSTFDDVKLILEVYN